MLAAGAARAEEVAIAAASPGAYDDMMEAAAADANLPLHFAHGRRALSTRDGQATAALADILVHGLSQDRVRRLIALAHAPGAPLSALPEGWRSMLPEGAPLNSPVRWRQVFAQGGEETKPAERALMPVIDLLHRGPEAAEEAGELCFPASHVRCGVAPSGARPRGPSSARSSSCGCRTPQTPPAASYGRRRPNSPPVHVPIRVCSASTPKLGPATPWRIRCFRRTWSRPRCWTCCHWPKRIGVISVPSA